MNREYLFRGLDVNSGEWVYGNLLLRRDSAYIESGRPHAEYDEVYQEIEVNPGTVGQYTGLNDKNRVKIFEGDILDKYWLFGKEETMNNVVYFGEEFDREADQRYLGWFCNGPLPENNTLSSVIGNVHQHKELLGVAK